tara:strand:- start:442 stop:630 length:189 start_codon:yes stop_codon:yes gene_type:complete
VCVICIDIEKDKLTALEARRNLNEMHSSLSEEHAQEVLQLIWKKEDEEYSRWYASAQDDNTD